MKKRAVIIRTVCYLLMLAAVLAWPIWQIIQAEYFKLQPQKFLLPVQSSAENEWEKLFEFQSGFSDGKKVFFISFRCTPAVHIVEIPVSEP